MLTKIILLLSIFASQSVNALTIAVPASTPSMLIYANVLKEIYKRAEIPLEFKTLPTQRALNQSSEGIVDGELVRIHKVGDLYPTLRRVPTSYTYFESRAFSRSAGAEMAIQRDGWHVLRDFRVGIVRGMKFAEEIDIKGWKNVEVVTGTDQLLRMLDSDRIDIAVTNKFSGLVLIKEFGLESVHLIKPAMQKHELYHYLHEKNKQYIPILDEVIRAMDESGELQQLNEKFTAELLEGTLEL